MSKRFYIIALLCAGMAISQYAFSTNLWTNSKNRIGAMFPSSPEMHEAVTSGGTGIAYQSNKRFNEGASLFAITIVPMDKNKLKNGTDVFLKAANSSFIESMGSDPKKATINWTKFGDGRSKLNYDFIFDYSGFKLKGKGYWIYDKNRAIRVSVAYMTTLKSVDIKETVAFLDTFILVK